MAGINRVPNSTNDQTLSNRQQLFYIVVRHWEKLIDLIEHNWLSEETIASDCDIQMQLDVGSIGRGVYGIFHTWANDK
jgi:hypothetical protein